MKVLVAASSFPRSIDDWRSRFILDMVASLAAPRGTHDEVSYWGPPGPIPEGVRDATPAADARWLDRLMKDGGLAHLLRSSPLAGVQASIGFLLRLRKALRAERGRQDVLHLNWLQNVLALPAGPEPVLVTVLGSDFGLLNNPLVRSLVRIGLARRRCLVAPNAGWMVAPLRDALGGSSEVQAIPFGVSTGWYEVQRKPDHPRRWLVVARVTRAKIGPLFEWGENIFHGGDELHLLGPMQDPLKIPGWVHYHGPTHPEELLQRWFPTAAGLLTLSRHDEGRPQVVLEAMASAMPVIASRQAAHEDIIRHGETGFIVGSPAELKAAVDEMSEPTHATRVGEAARAWAAQNIGTWTDTAMRYRAQYQRLLATVP